MPKSAVPVCTGTWPCCACAWITARSLALSVMIFAIAAPAEFV
jgi:hypothetical protein